MIQRTYKKIILPIFAALVFSVGINVFLVPAGLYSGGVLGIGQIIRSVLVDIFNLDFINVDIAGIIVYIINIPLFILAYFKLGKIFFFKTCFIVTVQTIFLTFIPNYKIIHDNPFASSIIGGILAGYGVGLLLREGVCGGGQDIIGLCMMKKNNNFSVGKVSIFINAVVFTCCLFMYNIETVIYSVIFIVVWSFVTDRVHSQNVNIKATIITDKPDKIKEIILDMKRSCTLIKAKGGYTNSDLYIIYSIISRYEADILKDKIQDEKCVLFADYTSVNKIIGLYSKHL